MASDARVGQDKVCPLIFIGSSGAGQAERDERLIERGAAVQQGFISGSVQQDKA